MTKTNYGRHILLLAGSLLLLAACAVRPPLGFDKIATFNTGLGKDSGEITCHDASTQRLYVINSAATSLAIVDFADPSVPATLKIIDLSNHGDGLTSVDCHDGRVAVAIAAERKTDRGRVHFLDADGRLEAEYRVGALPDMITFDHGGNRLLVANEGEPDEDSDPMGTISIIDISLGVKNAPVMQLDFRAFNHGKSRHSELPAGMVVFPGRRIANDFEPEYIAVSRDDHWAWVTLQENNTVAVIDLQRLRITDLHGLGFKDHSLAGNELDASDRDGGIRMANWPVHGMYQPDAIAGFKQADRHYYITANEGDARDEDVRIAEITLDAGAFPDAGTLQQGDAIGRLEASSIIGDDDGDGDMDRLLVYGGRSFSIRDGSTGELIFDSGSEIERETARVIPEKFNSSGTEETFDSRSDAKGPEPEGLATGVIDGNPYAFIGLERPGGVMVYDISEPAAARLIVYVPSTDGDLAPEGLVFVDADDNNSGQPLLLVSHEISGTVTVYRIRH